MLPAQDLCRLMIMAERMLILERVFSFASEQVSRYIDFNDRGIAVLFGMDAQAL